MQITLDTNALVVDRREVLLPLGRSAAHDLFGAPESFHDPQPAAPYGHRNNRAHVYDRAGFYLIEHHATRNIDSITFVFCPDEIRFGRPQASFDGILRLGGLEIDATTSERDLEASTLSLRRWLAGCWSAAGRIHVAVDTRGARLPSGRRSRKPRVISVSASASADALDGSRRGRL